jgi:uncharacterized protein HemY
MMSFATHRRCWTLVALLTLVPFLGFETAAADDPWQRLFETAREAQWQQEWDAARSAFERTLEFAEGLPAENPRLIWTLEQLAAVQVTLGRPSEAIALYERALELRESGEMGRESATAGTLSRLARVHGKLGDHERAELLYRRSLEVRDAAPDSQQAGLDLILYRFGALIESVRPGDEEAAALIERYVEPQSSAYRHLQAADFYTDREDLARAVEHYQLGLELAHGPDVDRQQLARLAFGLAATYETLGQFDQAEVEYYQLLAAQENRLGADHPFLAETLIRLGALYGRQEQWASAEPHLIRALDLKQRAWGECDLCTRGVRDQLCNVHVALDRADPLCSGGEAIATDRPQSEPTDEVIRLDAQAVERTKRGEVAQAVELARQSLVLRQVTHGEESLEVADGIGKLARLYQRQIRLALAAEMYAERLALLEQLLPADDARIPATINQLARLAQRRSRYDEAEQWFLREMAIRESSGQLLKVARILETLGQMNRSRQRYPEAATYFERAAQLWEEMAGAHAPEILENLTALAQVSIDQGKPEAPERVAPGRRASRDGGVSLARPEDGTMPIAR